MWKYKLNGEDIEAVRNTGANFLEIVAFVAPGRSAKLLAEDLAVEVAGERPVRVPVGEWLVKAPSWHKETGVMDFWVVADDRFRRTFVPIEVGTNYD